MGHESFRNLPTIRDTPEGLCVRFEIIRSLAVGDLVACVWLWGEL